MASIVGHDAFAYGLATLPDGALVSCGEDRSVRVWRESDGECEQVIVLPAVSVWNVATTPKGDIVAGSSDNTARVFTRRKERMADEAAVKVRRHRLLFTVSLSGLGAQEYEELVSATALNTTQVGGVNKTDLPGLEALKEPGAFHSPAVPTSPIDQRTGKKEGQVIMVKNGPNITAHQVR